MKPTPADWQGIQSAAEALRAGKLVVMPTETVYGLAADALNEEAVRAIFRAKGRPENNPLIVHACGLEDVRTVVGHWPHELSTLAERFWPGPLTVVLPKASLVPELVTGGLPTIAVRVPDHPVALALIRAAGRPLAAPSANLFSRVSPTRASDVDPEIARHAALILEGGACQVGLESTVLDLSEGEPRVLRPGAVSRAMLQAALGRPLVGGPPPVGHRSPGLYPRHYSPRTPLALVDTLVEQQPGLTFGVAAGPHQLTMPSDPVRYGAELYAALAHYDRLGLERLYVESPPDEPAWEAVLDRLKRAVG